VLLIVDVVLPVELELLVVEAVLLVVVEAVELVELEVVVVVVVIVVSLNTTLQYLFVSAVVRVLTI